MNSWRIGKVTITRIVELEAAGGTRFILPDATPEALASHHWLRPHFVDERGRLRMSVHALVVDTPDRRIVVDTCIGNDKERSIPAWSRLHGPFLDDLAAAGFPPDSIDAVLCTHLHVDHVGWNTRLDNGKWVPTFANARYLWHRAEFEHWSVHDQGDGGTVRQESILPVHEAGQVDLVEPDHVVTDEVRFEPTPGHTPGHVSVHITSRGEEAVITGDLMHHPAQCSHPEWNSGFDFDGDQAARTRREFLARYADRPVLILGTHFATPTAGKVVRDGDSYRFAV
jgi:glyoxylase-like metal-dependent hydrolase (beta-lactamase superfamily II)